jgi:pimeloyl-ACP methyl ester carboxylesterase
LLTVEGEWHFAPEEAHSPQQTVLSVLGTDSAPIFHKVHGWVKKWMPYEELFVPNAIHALQEMDPTAVAEGLARFFERHLF